MFIFCILYTHTTEMTGSTFGKPHTVTIHIYSALKSNEKALTQR
jgi:hypothetical protein